MAQFFTCPVLENIKNKEQVWATPFDSDIFYAELNFVFNRITRWGRNTNLLGYPYFPSKLNESLFTGSNSRYKLNPLNPIRYTDVFFSYNQKSFFINRRYITNNEPEFNLTFEKTEKLLLSKGYNISSDTFCSGGKYAEKTLMVISLISSITGHEWYLLPAILTQKRRVSIEQREGYYFKTASGIINRALNEFIRRKINPTQKEIIDFLIELIDNKEIYISEEHLIAQIYDRVRYYSNYEERYKSTWGSSDKNVILCKADFIKDTDVKTILSCI